jgi:hypothetical protein
MPLLAVRALINFLSFLGNGRYLLGRGILIQAYSSLFKLAQPLFKPIQAYSSLFKLIQAYSSLFKLIQACSSLFKLIQVESSRIQPSGVFVTSRFFITIRGGAPVAITKKATTRLLENNDFY